MRTAGRARRGERHRAALVRNSDREARAGPVGQRGRSLDGVAGTLLAGQRQLHLAILPRGRQRFNVETQVLQTATSKRNA